jgi:hypothetical protein
VRQQSPDGELGKTKKGSSSRASSQGVTRVLGYYLISINMRPRRVHVPVTGTSAVLSLLLSAVSTWNLHGITCGSWADPNADIALVVRCDFLELSERSVLVCGRGDGRRGVVGGSSECARCGCVGYTVKSATRLGIV